MIGPGEDVAAQRAHVDQTRTDLAEALRALEREAHDCARAARSRTGVPDVDALHVSYRWVMRAVEAFELAGYDLHTAAGGDG